MSDIPKDPTDPARTLPPEQYEIRREISGRGVGLVFEAVELETGRPVAAKVYRPATNLGGGLDPEDVAFGCRQFLREGEALMACNHRAVTRIRDCYETDDGAVWIMDLVGGETLADRIDLPARPDEGEVRALILPLLRALGEMHDNGALHLNLSPQNIAFNEVGQPVLMGFAMTRTALFRRLGAEAEHIAPDPYTALELASLGEPADPATDIYGLAALFYHLVTGSAPLPATARARQGDLPRAADSAGGDYSDRLLTFIDAGLELDLDDRPTSTGEWGRALLDS